MLGKDSLLPEAATGCVLLKKLFLTISQYSQKITCVGVFFSKACNFIRKETPAEVFSCDYCEIFKNTFSEDHFQWLLCISLPSLSQDVELISAHKSTFTRKQPEQWHSSIRFSENYFEKVNKNYNKELL